ncbi:MAG: hypothetical protein A2776_02285 [Candidatus Levybacteria bacterium RIFCSPHIGHO2_01_FULL_40_10]|nr:MAG: hypothetical protein A2776_02285 [Candidatus Levybacteria bacterium RIFCSPHIGHO2_01_FULL_40_10]
MAARKKSSGGSSSSFFSKDLFMFIFIMAVVAFVTYILTYNAIMAKFNQQLGAYGNYQSLPSSK